MEGFKMRVVFGIISLALIDAASENFRIPDDPLLDLYGRILPSSYHMEEDKYRPGNILFTGVSGLWTYNGSNAEIIVGNTTRGYAEGVGINALFNAPRGFTQVSPTQVVVADTGNNCFRLVDRNSNQTSRYIGTCQDTADYRDGSDPLLSLPLRIIQDIKNPNSLIFTEAALLKRINITPSRFVQTMATQFQNIGSPIYFRELAQDSDSGDLYIISGTNIVKYDYITGITQLLSGTSSYGHADGNLLQAQYNSPWGLLILNDKKLVVSDSGNHRLRVLDLKANKTWSICSGVAGTVGGIKKWCRLERPAAMTVMGNVLYVATSQDTIMIEGEHEAEVTAATVPINVIEKPSVTIAIAVIVTVGIVVIIIAASAVAAVRIHRTFEPRARDQELQSPCTHLMLAARSCRSLKCCCGPETNQPDVNLAVIGRPAEAPDLPPRRDLPKQDDEGYELPVGTARDGDDVYDDVGDGYGYVGPQQHNT